jgi:hypothetical protein
MASILEPPHAAVATALAETRLPSAPVSSLGEPMFWRHTTAYSGPPGREMSSYVRERLRLALEFATLGTYGLSDGHADHDDGLWPHEHGDRDRQVAEDAAREPLEADRGEAPAEAHLCDRRRNEAPSPPRPHAVAPASATTCTLAAAPTSDCSALERGERARLRTGTARRPWRHHFRAGQAPAPQQPCIWVPHRMARRGP